MSEEFTEAEVEVSAVANNGKVITDINAMTMEEMHKLAMAPDYNDNPVIQGIVAKWKLVHLGIE